MELCENPRTLSSLHYGGKRYSGIFADNWTPLAIETRDKYIIKGRTFPRKISVRMAIRSSPAHSNGFACQSPHRPNHPSAVGACIVELATISIQPAAAAEAQPRA